MKTFDPVKLKKVASYKYPDTSKGHAEFQATLSKAEADGYTTEYRRNSVPVNGSWLNLILLNWETVWTLDIFEKDN